jgi:pimeloyl-ACP methyl ester carboxylesterase
MDSSVDVDGRRVGVWRFGSSGGWPLFWCHGGLSCGQDAKLLDAAGRGLGADIIAIDRPGIGRSDLWEVSSIAEWPHTVEQVADGLWADVLLILAARRSVPAASALLRLGRMVPGRYAAGEIRRSAGSRDRAALTGPTLSWLLAAHRDATVRGVRGTAQDYRRFGGAWGVDLGAIGRTVTVWQGEQDALLPMNHARRLADALPRSTLKVVPSTGHFLPVVIADAVIDDLAPAR